MTAGVERRARRGTLKAGALVAGLSALTSLGGCGESSDACKGQSETCLSLTLYGSDGVTRADQLQVMFMRKPKPDMPMMPLGSPQDLPFKVAVLWPDGPATISVRAMLSGQLAGVSPEFSIDLRNGQHVQRKLTLYSPLPGNGELPDLATRSDLSSPPRDMATSNPDLAEPQDLAEPTPPDLSVPPPPIDLALPIDLAMLPPIDL